MEINYFILILSVVSFLGLLGILLYRRRKGKGINFSAERVKPAISVVLIVRNNETLIKPVLKRSLELAAETEIIIFDLGSIDKTIEIAKEILSAYVNAKVLSIGNRTAWDNVRILYPRYVSGDCVFLIDLNKINQQNPNIYVPDLFKNTLRFKAKGLPKPDSRIDGVNLLRLDQDEREKNGYVLTEQIIESLSNLSLRLETLENKTLSDVNLIKEELSLMSLYIQEKIRDVALLTQLIGPVLLEKEKFNGQVISLLKSFATMKGISIDYKVTGKEQELKTPVNRLIISIIRDLLYVIVQVNLAVLVKVNCHYSHKKLSYVIKYECSELGNLKQENTLPAYVLRSMRNKLNLVGGNLRIKERGRGIIVILVQLPLDATTICDQEGEYET